MIEKIKQFGFFTYGTIILGLMIHGKAVPYPVLSERAIHAGAGITFVIAFFAFMQALYLGEYLYLQIAVSIFFSTFL